jgi:hypothetical protein
MQESLEEIDEMELEVFLKVMESDQLQLNAMFEGMDVLIAIANTLSRFRNNLLQIEDLLTKSDLSTNGFLLGHIYSAAVGAYELFMRELICSLIESTQLYDRLKDALSSKINNEFFVNIPKLKEFKESPSKRSLLNLIYKTTFIDAQKVTNSIRVWLGFEIPVLNNSEEVTMKRNIFTHNGGMRRDGSFQPIEIDEILALIEELDGNIATAATIVADKIEKMNSVSSKQ